MKSILRYGLMLASPVLFSGCSTLPVVIADSAALCQDWRSISVSKTDKMTEQTASEIEANNKSRQAWGCVKNG